jgi:hypothetical protein
MANPHFPPEDLHQFFSSLIERSLIEELGWPDFAVSDYLVNLLVDFSNIDRLVPVKYSWGLSGDLLASLPLESTTIEESYLIIEEDEFHRHIADAILFTVGLFPDELCQTKPDQSLATHEIIPTYMEVGKEAYSRVSHMKAGYSSEETELFEKLSANFVVCVYCLDGIAERFQSQQGTVFQKTKDFFFQ